MVSQNFLKDDLNVPYTLSNNRRVLSLDRPGRWEAATFH